MISVPLIVALSCVFILPISGRSVPAVSIDAAKAHNFLAHSRAQPEGIPKWYHKDPDFQSYYRYYTSIGHTEGLYEIDKLRIIYQQMRHLEQTYGPDASTYQNILGVPHPKAPLPPPPSTKSPPPAVHPPAPAPLTQAEIKYLCNPKDPLCKPHIVYLPTGAVPVLCDPRYHPQCKLSGKKEAPRPPATPPEPETPAPPPPPPPPPMKKVVPPPPPMKKVVPPPPHPLIIKGMEYDCDPYWDPDCLIDNPPRPVKMSVPVAVHPIKRPVVEMVTKEKEDPVPPALDDKGIPMGPYGHYDPYDYRRDLYDPYIYANPGPIPQQDSA